MTAMKTKLLSISSAVFLILSIAFALYWDNIYNGGPGEQKGDYIIFCLKGTIILAFFYVVLVRLVIRKMFPLVFLLIIPLITCFASAILAIAVSIITGKTNDVSVLQVYLFIHGFCSILFVSLVTYFAKKNLS
jgi:hypothetical protein